jgi:hypothetical protein
MGLMRLIYCVAFATLLASTANSADRQSAAAAVEGCLGQEAHVCEHSFSRVLSEVEAGENLDQQLKSHTAIRLSGFAPNISGSFTLIAEIGKTRRVTSASIILPMILSSASTESGYAKSGLYEGVVILLGSSCTQSPDALYRLFEDTIKPTLKAVPKQDKPDSSLASETYFEKAKTAHLCKHALTYSVLFGTDTYHMTLKDPHGSFIFPVVAVQ